MILAELAPEACACGFVFVGIHNARDTVTYVTLAAARKRKAQAAAAEAAERPAASGGAPAASKDVEPPGP